MLVKFFLGSKTVITDPSLTAFRFRVLGSGNLWALIRRLSNGIFERAMLDHYAVLSGPEHGLLQGLLVGFKNRQRWCCWLSSTLLTRSRAAGTLPYTGWREAASPESNGSP